MLNRYSTLPSLQLTLNSSRQRRCFILTLAFAAVVASYNICIKGYPILGIAVFIVSFFLLWRSRIDPMDGSVLIWEAGEWFLQRAGGRTSVLLQPASLRHPWVIYLDLRETYTRKRWRLWLFSDSADTELLRQLRSRLTLHKA